MIFRILAVVWPKRSWNFIFAVMLRNLVTSTFVQNNNQMDIIQFLIILYCSCSLCNSIKMLSDYFELVVICICSIISNIAAYFSFFFYRQCAKKFQWWMSLLFHHHLKVRLTVRVLNSGSFLTSHFYMLYKKVNILNLPKWNQIKNNFVQLIWLLSVIK